MAAIPYLKERMTLVALHKQWEELDRLEEEAVAAPKAAYDEERKRLAQEYPLAFNGRLSLNDEDQLRQHKEAREKLEPFHAAMREAREPFRSRQETVLQEISEIKKAIGGGFYDDGTGESTRHFCAITGLPLLERDDVRLVLATALPSIAERKLD